jgi:hypothetical protein
MNVTVEFKGLKEVIASMDDLAKKQVPYALSVALNQTAEDVIRAEKQQLQIYVKGGPTAWTSNSLFVDRATKTKPVATVGFKDKSSIRVTTTNKGRGTPAANYMGPLVDGGPRNLKGFESALRWAYILPPGMYIAPGKACPLDAHGNIPHSFIMKILSYFKASERWSGHTSNITDKGRAKLKAGTRRNVGHEYFVSYGKGRTQHLPPGIYIRYSGTGTKTIRPIMMFVKSPAYQKRIPFHETAQKIIDIKLKFNFDNAMREAIRTAKLKG